MIRGGLRSRFITDSLRLTVVAGLGQLGWFDPTVYDTPPGTRSHRPVSYIARPASWDVPVEPNCVAISTEGMTDEPHGLGDEVDDTQRCYIDVLAENDQVGWHLARDIRDLVFGQMADLGRTGPVIDVYDFRLATPTAFTTVGVERILMDRGMAASHPWTAHWYMVRVDLVDEYYDEFGAPQVTSSWSSDFKPAWDRIQLAEASG